MKLLLALLSALLLSPAQDPAPAAFFARSQLVLVPFHVARNKFYVSDLKSSDIVLLEDGHPRPFATFEAPNAQKRTLELVLLFDSTMKGLPKESWDLSRIYGFIHDWNESQSRQVLEQGKADVLASVYRFNQNQLQRLCLATLDPKVLLDAFQRMLTPFPTEESITLTPAPGIPPRHATQEGPLAWTADAGIATLQQAAMKQDHRSRAFVLSPEATWLWTPRACQRLRSTSEFHCIQST